MISWKCGESYSVHFSLLKMSHCLVHFDSPLVLLKTVEAKWKNNQPFWILVMDVTLLVNSFGEQPTYYIVIKIKAVCRGKFLLVLNVHRSIIIFVSNFLLQILLFFGHNFCQLVRYDFISLQRFAGAQNAPVGYHI